MSISTRISQRQAAFSGWLWDENSSASTPIRGALRVFFIFCREFQRDNIPLRASALTFTIVLSLVPTLALGTAVLKGLGAGDQMRQAAYRFIDQLDSQDTSATPESPGDTTAQQDSASEDTQLGGHLRRATEQIFDYVDRTDFATLGAFGVIGLVMAVLSVLGSIERAMNAIWQAGSGRPFGRKLMDYLALMILLPLSVNLALGTETLLQSQSLLDLVYKVLPIAGLSHFLLKIFPALLVVVTFSLLYRFLPNTRVKIVPSLVGGAVGGISWLLIQALYVKLQIGVARYNAIYGSFATLPLFLLWLNIAWIVFLSGAEAAFACQVWPDYRWHNPDLTPARRLSLAFRVLTDITAAFKERRAPSTDDLTAACQGCSKAEVDKVVWQLVEGGMVRPVENGGYLPAAPLAELKASELVGLVLGEDGEDGHPLAEKAMAAASESVRDDYLAR